MWELAIGIVVMVGLFAVLLAGMVVVTRTDEADIDPGDLRPAGAGTRLPDTLVIERPQAQPAGAPPAGAGVGRG